MNQETVQILHTCTIQSFSGEKTFPEVVRQLQEIDVEFYHVDLIRMEKICYFPDGTSHLEPMAFSGPSIAAEFRAGSVQKAIEASQQGRITYPEFLKQVMTAGTAYYYVFIRGEQAIYTGRCGESHVEPFPRSTTAQKESMTASR